MPNKWNLIPVILVAIQFLMVDDATAQARQTDLPWHLTEQGGRIAALGHSTAALDNQPYFNPNPAIPVEYGHIYFSSPVFSTTVVSGNPAVFSGNHIDASRYSPYMAIGWDRISVSAALRHTNHSDLENWMLRTHIAYRLSDFYLGVGLQFSSAGADSNPQCSKLYKHELFSGWHAFLLEPAYGVMKFSAHRTSHHEMFRTGQTVIFLKNNPNLERRLL